MSAPLATSARSLPEHERPFGGLPELSPAVWLRIGQAALRWFAVGIIVLVLAATWMYVSATVDSYAVHLCGWPATISCEPSPIWSLVTIGFGLTVVVGVLTAITWATSNRGGWLAAAYAIWIALFPKLVHMTGPWKFDQSDLVVLGGYAGLAIELLRRSAVLWAPTWRQQWSTAAFSSALVYAVLLSLVPTHLASLTS